MNLNRRAPKRTTKKLLRELSQFYGLWHNALGEPEQFVYFKGHDGRVNWRKQLSSGDYLIAQLELSDHMVHSMIYIEGSSFYVRISMQFSIRELWAKLDDALMLAYRNRSVRKLVAEVYELLLEPTKHIG